MKLTLSEIHAINTGKADKELLAKAKAADEEKAALRAGKKPEAVKAAAKK